MATLDSGRQRYSMYSCASHQRPLERPHWQAEALRVLQAEIDAKEAWARQFGEPHCRVLIERCSKGLVP